MNSQESHFNTNQIEPEQPDEQSDESYVSKTQLKNEAKSLQVFGKSLVELAETRLKALPLSEVTLQALTDYHKQSGNIAKKRHLSFIGKCLRNEDVEAIKNALSEGSFDSQRAKKQGEKITLTAEKIIAEGDKAIEDLLTENSTLERQTLRQLVRNYAKAKETKKAAALAKLTSYLSANIKG